LDGFFHEHGDGVGDCEWTYARRAGRIVTTVQKSFAFVHDHDRNETRVVETTWRLVNETWMRGAARTIETHELMAADAERSVEELRGREFKRRERAKRAAMKPGYHAPMRRSLFAREMVG